MQTIQKAPRVYFELKTFVAPIIQAFHADLIKHDRRTIRNHPTTPFIHAAGPCGTCLLMLSPADEYPPAGETVPYLFARAGRDHILNEYTGMIECYARNGRPTMHHHDGRGNIRPITHAQAKEIVREYQANIRFIWDNENIHN